jgi:predicted nucleotide-binding protein (sugar kinase/HSP70/actin superfamily)
MVSLQNRGYTYEQISELLKADGIEIRIEALKNRLQQLKLQKQPKNLF